jgi:hypothetical protein
MNFLTLFFLLELLPLPLCNLCRERQDLFLTGSLYVLAINVYMISDLLWAVSDLARQAKYTVVFNRLFLNT